MEAALHSPLSTEADRAEAAAPRRCADIPTQLGGPAGKSRDVIRAVLSSYRVSYAFERTAAVVRVVAPRAAAAGAAASVRGASSCPSDSCASRARAARRLRVCR